MGVETLADFLRSRAIGLRTRHVASRLHPCRSIGKRRILHEARVIMMTLFPKIETGLSPMLKRIVEIELEQRCYRRLVDAITKRVKQEKVCFGVQF